MLERRRLPPWLLRASVESEAEDDEDSDSDNGSDRGVDADEEVDVVDEEDGGGVDGVIGVAVGMGDDGVEGSS